MAWEPGVFVKATYSNTYLHIHTVTPLKDFPSSTATWPVQTGQEETNYMFWSTVYPPMPFRSSVSNFRIVTLYLWWPVAILTWFEIAELPPFPLLWLSTFFLTIAQKSNRKHWQMTSTVLATNDQWYVTFLISQSLLLKIKHLNAKLWRLHFPTFLYIIWKTSPNETFSPWACMYRLPLLPSIYH